MLHQHLQRRWPLIKAAGSHASNPVLSAFRRQHRQQPTTICKAAFGSGAKQKKGTDNQKQQTAAPSSCPCCSGRPYNDCCRPLHRSSDPKPLTPEAALRARFSAFPKRELQYLKRSSHRENPARGGSRNEELGKACTWEEDLAVTAAVLRFEQLKVLGVEYDLPGESGADSAAGSSSSSAKGSEPDTSRPSRAAVRYEFTFKRVVDEAGQLIKSPQLQVARESAVFMNDDGAWLLLDSAPLQDEEGGADVELQAADAAVP